MVTPRPEDKSVPFVAPNLPEEILSLIAEKADYETALRLRFLGDALSWGAAQVIFRHIVMSMSRANAGRLFQLCDSIYARVVRTLEIRAPVHHDVHPDDISEQEICAIGKAVAQLSRLERIIFHLDINVMIAMQASPYTSNIMRSIIESASKIKPTPRLAIFAQGAYDIEGDPQNWGAFNDFKSGYLSGFKDIELNVGSHITAFPDSATLKDFIADACQNVVTLKLSGDTWLKLQRSNDAPKFQMPNLREVSLDCFLCSAEALINLLSSSAGKLTNVRLSAIELIASSYVPPPGVENHTGMTKKWQHVLDYLRLNCSDLVEFDYSMLIYNLVEDLLDFGDLDEDPKYIPAWWKKQWGTYSESNIRLADKEDMLAQGRLLHQVNQNSLAKRGCASTMTHYSRRKMEDAMSYDRTSTRSSQRRAAAEARRRILGPK